jgi:hypothetical protein
MSIEAMKQALEALDSDNPDIQLRAATALRAAIEQAEKPWVKTYSGGKPNYTVPIERQWVGLTEDELKLLWEQYGYKSAMCKPFAHAIEAKLKEKNHG